MSTQQGSTPPVHDARLDPHPNVVYMPSFELSDSSVKVSQHAIRVPGIPSVKHLLLPIQSHSPIEISQVFKDKADGVHGGQCAAFVQLARPELAGFGNANQMPAKAKGMGFEVNGIPRVGSVLAIKKPSGSEYGHAAVVTSVMRIGNKYLLSIKDSNASLDEKISSRTAIYTASKDGEFGNYGKYEESSPDSTRLAKDLVVIGFIHEKLPDDTK